MALDTEHVRAHFQVGRPPNRLPTPINEKGDTL